MLYTEYRETKSFTTGVTSTVMIGKL